MLTATSRNTTASATVSDGVVTIEIRGQIDGPTLLDLKGQLNGHPEICDERRLLVDMSGADLATLSADDVRHIALLPPLLSATARYALVVPDDLGFGLARMFEILRGDTFPFTCVFRDAEEARRWILDDHRGTSAIDP